jgi:transposase
LYNVYQEAIRSCDEEIEALLSEIEKKAGTEEVPNSSKRSQKRHQTNVPRFDMRSYLYKIIGTDLTRIDGLSGYSVMQLFTEIGTDMSRWPTAKHFTSWLGLSPNNKISGDRVISSRTSRNKNKAGLVFRTVAQALSHSKSALGAYFRRLRARIGAPKACVASARKIAEMFYRMLKNRETYTDPGEQQYVQQFKERQLKSLQKRAAIMGYDLIPAPCVS